MTLLRLSVRPMTEEAISVLEERGLVRRLLPSAQVLDAPQGTVAVDRHYASASWFGAHMLIGVGFNKSEVALAYHSDNEEFLLINEGRQQKPLILVVSLVPAVELRKLVSAGQLTADDVWALELKFNDPRLSFFTMNAFTPHCEWTVPGPGPASVFFVTESAALDAQPIDMGEYELDVARPSAGC